MTSRHDSTGYPSIVASTVSVHKTPDKFAKKVGYGNWNSGGPRTSQLRMILASTGRPSRSSSDEEVP